MVALCCFFMTNTFAQSGAIDTEFGNNGIVRQSFGSINDVLTDMVIQTDGKIITSGFAWPEAVLARFNSDGTLDVDFGDNGKVYATFGFEINSINKMVLQPNGKVVVVGRTGMNFSNHEETFVARYDENGSLDDTFGENGSILIETEFFSSIGKSVIVLEDGRILVASRVDNSNMLLRIMLTRLHSDGQLDVSFGTNGSKLISFGEQSNILTTLVQQPDGMIIVGGALKRPVSPGYDFAMIRFDEDGLVDNSFGNNGVIVSPEGSDGNYIHDIKIQSDNKIVAVGSDGDSIAIVRYLENGTLDTSFGENGVIKTQIEGFKTGGGRV